MTQGRLNVCGLFFNVLHENTIISAIVDQPKWTIRNKICGKSTPLVSG